MSKFFIRWHVDNSKMPAAPEETGKLVISILETVEAGLHTGKLKDWGQLGNGRDGYAIVSQTKRSFSLPCSNGCRS